MVMWKPAGPIRRLAARSIPSTIAPLLLSAKFSAQFELNDFFDFFHLAVADKNEQDPSIFAKAFERILRHVHCVINLVICFVTSCPRMTGLVNG